MKITNLFILLIILSATEIFAVCDEEPTIAAAGKVLKELKIKSRRTAAPDTSAEIGLFIEASVKNSSWQTKGAEAAVLTVFVDGKYNQDAILFAGEKTFEYQMLLGKYNSGEHRITIVLNEKHSAPNALNVEIRTAFSTIFEDLTVTKPADRSIPACIAAVNAPLIYLRPETIDKFSDIPLLTYYEIFDEPDNIKKIRYTTIFTNEDGGTRSAALMARWGRMTDIEWIYEMRVRLSGEILTEIYQGANHETKSFTGKRFASHPMLFDATVNNNFSDAGCSPLRLSPRLVQTNLSNGSRETVMDAFPWTYRIMAQEAFREKRVDSNNPNADTIADPRDYIYVEIYNEPKNAAVAVEIKSSDGRTISSDQGNPSLRVSRPGFVRIALQMPTQTRGRFPASLSINCHLISNAAAAPEGKCRNLNLLKVVRLDDDFSPKQIKISAKPQDTAAGKVLEFAIESE